MFFGMRAQLRKLGKVYTRPTSKIQMLQNASLALKAIADDNVKLVNVGEWRHVT